jgi:hypothetical protein
MGEELVKDVGDDEDVLDFFSSLSKDLQVETKSDAFVLLLGSLSCVFREADWR